MPVQKGWSSSHHIPTDWISYKGHVDKRCWSSATKTQQRYRDKYIPDYSNLSSNQRKQRWLDFLENVYKKEVEPKKSSLKIRRQRQVSKAREVLKNKSNPLGTKDPNQMKEMARKSSIARGKMKNELAKLKFEALECWDKIWEGNKKTVQIYLQDYMAPDTIELLAKVDPSKKGFHSSDIRSQKELKYQYERIIAASKEEIPILDLLEGFTKTKHPRQSEELSEGEEKPIAPDLDKGSAEKAVESFNKAAAEVKANMSTFRPEGSKYGITTNTSLILSQTAKYRIASGGARSGKTVAYIMHDINNCVVNPGWDHGVLGLTKRHIMDVTFKIFKDVMLDWGLWIEDNWKSSRMTYEFENGSQFVFISADKLEGSVGVEKDSWFLNEANHLPWSYVEQIISRVVNYVNIDFNPSGKFWVHTKLLQDKYRRPHVDFLQELTYLGNELLPESQIVSLEASQGNKAWWEIYGKGKLGDIDDLVYKDWQLLDREDYPGSKVVPHEAVLVYRGVDPGGYGTGSNKMAVVAIYKYKNGFILDEELYDDSMSDHTLAEILNNNLKLVPSIVDPVDTTLKTLREAGVSVIEGDRSPYSIGPQVRFIQSCRIWVTRRSINLMNEKNSYYWKKDKDGNKLSTPDDRTPHDLLDAARYGLQPFITKAKEDDDRSIQRFNRSNRIVGLNSLRG